MVGCPQTTKNHYTVRQLLLRLQWPCAMHPDGSAAAPTTECAKLTVGHDAGADAG